jgi:ABC-type sugar transport system permease subunit
VLDHEQALGYLLVAPVVILLLTLVAYPFFIAVYLALTDRTIGNPGTFIGLTNVQRLFNNQTIAGAAQHADLYRRARGC